MEFKYKATPMFRRPLTTEIVMLRLLAGLLIVYGFGLYNAYTWGVEYFVNGLLLLAVSLAVSVLTETVYALVLKQNPLKFLRKSFPWITSIILVLIVPVNTSLYVIGVATFLGIFFGKLVFGGFGQNVFNPAAVSRAIIGTTFSGVVALDAVASPTITTSFASLNWLTDKVSLGKFINEFGGLGSILSGTYFGAMGETCTILILVICVLYAIFDVIDWRIPLTYLGVMFLGASCIALVKGLGIEYPIMFISTGGAAFGAVFMLTDPVTNPQTRPGKIVFAAIAALLTVLIRFLGKLPEGVVFSILLANILSPVIDKIFSTKQIVSIKRNSFITFGTIAVVVVCIFLTGNATNGKQYIALEDSPTIFKNYDFTENDAVVTDLGGGRYHVTVKGYGLISGSNNSSHNYARNEFDITIVDGKVSNIVCTVFGDTEGIGSGATSEDYLGNFVGVSLMDNVIDTFTGASYTSRSVMAAVQAALKEASK